MNNPAATSRSGISLWSVYVWTLSYLKPYRLLLALLIAAAAAVSAAELVIPRFVRHFIDVLLPASDRVGFYRSMALLACIIAALIGANMAQNMLRRMIQERAARDLQLAIFGKLRALGFAYFERTPVGETLSLLNTEVAAVQNLYRQGFPWMIDGLLFSVISIALMLFTHVGLTLIVIPCFLLYYIFGPTLERKASVSGKQMSQHRIDENRKAYESISAAAELRAYSAERWDTERYLDNVDAYNRSMIRTYWYAYLRGTNRRLTYYAGAVAVFGYGYYLIGADRLTIGAFVSFLLYYFTAMHRLTSVVTNITEQKVLMYQAEKLYAFMRQSPQTAEPERPRTLHAVKGEIRFAGVEFGYGPDAPVLRGFELTVRQGRRVALVGHSGCGKSTALKLIGRFYDPDAGRIELDGVPIRELPLGTLRQSLGFVFQETYLFGASIKENIRFGRPDATDEEVVAAAEAAHAHDFIVKLPNGYDTPVGERGVKLSGGQKQRIAIARMFAKNPAVVLLDEATSALDNASEREVQSALDRLLEGRTVIAVAHRLSTVDHFDAIAVVENGRIVEYGTYAELMRASGPFRRLVEGSEAREGASARV
ncbi:ABC transporter ATP-binding protein [Paenibacillus sp. GYB003]|uniref:ABC transporter ATP-binding protein n=1 Tax=Paenibacillus sp. GYB003 TaxID=2994392 RepID=UPI002F965527